MDRLQKYIPGTHQNCFMEVLQMSTYNVCFHAEIGKMLQGYPLFFDLHVYFIWRRQLTTKTDW